MKAHRISAGAAALIFFAIFFALPLYAAATMCTMPCCHRGSATPALKGDLPCPGRACVTSADDTTVKAVSRFVAPAFTVAAELPVTASLVPSVASAPKIAPSPPPGALGLHLLHSVFRI